MKKAKPNPGSKEATDAGCKCPVMDNNYGSGIPTSIGEPNFWINDNCPIHGSKIV